MTTANYNAVIDHTTDAAFRAWGAAFAAGLLAAGLVQASDTGQINWTTVTRPGTGVTSAGYEVWRLTDSSLYFKFEYGNAGVTTIPLMWVTVGTGTNGAGTVNAPNSGQLRWSSPYSGNPTGFSTATMYQTYICVTAGSLGIIWGANASSNGTPLGFMVASRSVDANGAHTSTGFSVIHQRGANVDGPPTMICVRTASPTKVGNDSLYYCLAAGAPAASTDANGDNRVWLMWSDYYAQMEPFIATLAYITSEWTELTTKTLTPFGLTARTYLAVGLLSRESAGVAVGVANGGSSVSYSIAMLWEP